MTRPARDLHPVAWWLWAIGLAAAASLSSNPVWMVLLVLVAAVVVLARRGDQPWARSFRLYCYLGLGIVLLRVLFRVLLGGSVGSTVLLDLPEVPLPDWVAGVRLLGPVTAESLLGGLYDGLRLAAIVVCVGAANALANPKRLLKSVPPALYEIGTALVVAVSVLPQLADSARRVRAAQQLRGGGGGRVRGLRRVLVPVLEDAFDRSVRLAAGMDTRGYGRSAGAAPGERAVTGTLMVAGLLGLCVGVYGMLDQTGSMPAWLGGPMVVAGLAVAALGLVSAGRRVRRTRYRADSWRWPELVVVASGTVVAAVAAGVAASDPAVAHPPVTVVPTLTGASLVGLLVALLPAVAAPPPVTAATTTAAAPEPTGAGVAA